MATGDDSYRAQGILTDLERQERPEQPRQLSVQQLFAGGRLDVSRVVPVETVRTGDCQVLAARGVGSSDPQLIDLEWLRQFPSVRSVVASAAIKTNAQLPEVDELLMIPRRGPAPSSAPTADTLGNLPSLRELWLGNTGSKPPLAIERLPVELTALGFNRHLLENGMQKKASFEQLSRFRDLRMLRLDQCWPGDSIACAADLTQLVRLHCDAPLGWRALRSCDKLEDVRAIKPRIANFEAFHRWARLERLLMTGEGVQSLKGASAFQSLRQIRLVMMKIDDLTPLAALPWLEEVQLKGLKNLKSLSALGTMPALRRLTLASAGTADRDIMRIDSLKPLASAGNLEELKLDGATIEDRDLAPLTGLPRLRKVQLFGDLQAAVDSLRKARPDLEISLRPGPSVVGEKIGPVRLRPPVVGSALWWISEDLTGIIGTRTNYDAEAKLLRLLKATHLELISNLSFDTEADAVVICSHEVASLRRVAQFILSLMSPH